MITEIDAAWATLVAINTHNTHNKQFIDMVIPTNTKTVRGLTVGKTIFPDKEDLRPTPSTNEPNINRKLRNVNSNKLLEKNGLVNNNYGETNGWVLTTLGQEIVKSKDAFLFLINNTEKYFFGYGDTPKPAKQRTVHNTTTTTQVNSKAVKMAAKQRANHTCECCNKQMFIGKDDKPYLEVHHIYNKHPIPNSNIPNTRYDHYRHVAAICPTCHTNIHHGINGSDINEKLFTKITLIIKIEIEIADGNMENYEYLLNVKNSTCF